MKAKIFILMMVGVSLISCKTRRLQKIKSIEHHKTEQTITKDSVSNEGKVEKKTATKEVRQSEKQKQTKTEFEVKGRAETDKPIEISQVENGDTLQVIKIVGNAEVFYKRKTSERKETKATEHIENVQNNIATISRTIVNEKNLKETADQIESVVKNVTVKNGTFGSFFTVIIIGITAILLLIIIIYIKRKI